MIKILGTIVLVIVLLAIMFVCVMYLIVCFKAMKETNANKAKGASNRIEMDPETELMLGAMGAQILDNRIEKHRRERERKERESLFWQEAIREKHSRH